MCYGVSGDDVDTMPGSARFFLGAKGTRIAEECGDNRHPEPQLRQGWSGQCRLDIHSPKLGLGFEGCAGPFKGSRFLPFFPRPTSQNPYYSHCSFFSPRARVTDLLRTRDFPFPHERTTSPFKGQPRKDHWSPSLLRHARRASLALVSTLARVQPKVTRQGYL
jgi:hypothetical protein